MKRRAECKVCEGFGAVDRWSANLGYTTVDCEHCEGEGSVDIVEVPKLCERCEKPIVDLSRAQSAWCACCETQQHVERYEREMMRYAERGDEVGVERCALMIKALEQPKP